MITRRADLSFRVVREAKTYIHPLTVSTNIPVVVCRACVCLRMLAAQQVAQLHMAHAESRPFRRAVTLGTADFAFLTALFLLLAVAPTRPTERVSIPGGRARAREKPSNWVGLISSGQARQSSERVVAPKASIPHPRPGVHVRISNTRKYLQKNSQSDMLFPRKKRTLY